MKRPSFQFYPSDWSTNTKLRRCSFRERGVWIEVMGLMHDSDEYGVLRWPLREIMDALGCKPSDLEGLRTRQVMKGVESGAFDGHSFRPVHGRKLGQPVQLIAPCNGPIYYSTRMVEDEYKRIARGIHGGKGDPNYGDDAGHTNAPKGAPIPPISPPPSSSSSSSSENVGVASQPVGLTPDAVPAKPGDKVNDAKAANGRALANAAREILTFLNERAGKRFPDSDSNVGIIVARMKEGFAPADLRQVVVMRVRMWKGSEKMAEYLRPATLFGRTNFSNYVGELVDDVPDDQTAGEPS